MSATGEDMKLTKKQKQIIHDAIDSAWAEYKKDFSWDERIALIHKRIENAFKK